MCFCVACYAKQGNMMRTRHCVVRLSTERVSIIPLGILEVVNLLLMYVRGSWRHLVAAGSEGGKSEPWEAGKEEVDQRRRRKVTMAEMEVMMQIMSVRLSLGDFCPSFLSRKIKFRKTSWGQAQQPRPDSRAGDNRRSKRICKPSCFQTSPY